MFKIGDFSRVSQVSVRMLRHYDKLGLLAPGHIDKFTGYRYYTLDQLPRLNRIVALNDLGLTLQQISELLGDEGDLPVEQLRGMLALRRVEIEREIADKRWQLANVEMRLQQIEHEHDPEPYEIVVKELPPLHVASLRHLSPTILEVGYFCETLYGQLYTRLEELGVTPLEPEMTFYHNEEYADTDIDMEVAVPVDEMVAHTPPADDYLIFREEPGRALAAALVFEGEYSEVGGPIQSLLKWIGQHNHTTAGPLRELHLSGRSHGCGIVAASVPVIEIQVPITPIK